MKIKQTIIIFVLMLVATCFGAIPSVSAADTCGGVQVLLLKCDDATLADGAGVCADSSVIGGDEIAAGVLCPDGNPAVAADKPAIWGLLLVLVNLMTYGAGIAGIGGIIFGSVLYMSAGGNAEQVKKARTVIINVVIGLILFALLFSIVNFVTPGGFLT